MTRSLRKGRSSVYIQHEHTGHQIGAERFESEVSAGTAVLRFWFRPVDGNQREDLDYTLNHPILWIDLSDSLVIDAFARHVNAGNPTVSTFEVHACTKTEIITLHVAPEQEQHGLLTVLRFHVTDRPN